MVVMVVMGNGGYGYRYRYGYRAVENQGRTKDHGPGTLVTRPLGP